MTIEDFCDCGGEFIIYSPQVPRHIHIGRSRDTAGAYLWTTHWKGQEKLTPHESLLHALAFVMETLANVDR